MSPADASGVFRVATLGTPQVVADGSVGISVATWGSGQVMAGVNPTPTIQALALYIADQIKNRLANLFD